MKSLLYTRDLLSLCPSTILPWILMMKCEYEKDFQTFAQHGGQNWRKSYIPKKKKKKKKRFRLNTFYRLFLF